MSGKQQPQKTVGNGQNGGRGSMRNGGGQTVLYMKGDKDVEVDKKDIALEDILTLECADKAVLGSVKKIRLLHIKKTGQQRYVVSVLKIISLIHEKYPDIIVENLGEADIIITYEEQKGKGKVWHIVKAAFVAAVTFCGAAFSIMAFNNDVDLTKLFGQIYTLVTGSESDGFTILEISYSVGITAGILIFFNHFGKKRFTVDPTPMEVQMRLYENDIQTTLIEDAARKGDEIDVGNTGMGGTDPSGSSGT